VPGARCQVPGVGGHVSEAISGAGFQVRGFRCQSPRECGCSFPYFLSPIPYLEGTAAVLFPIPYSLFPIPCSLFPVPYSLFPVPCSLFPIPYSLFPVPYSLFPIPYSLFPIPYSLFPVPYSLYRHLAPDTCFTAFGRRRSNHRRANPWVSSAPGIPRR
jgi:hypothetical protein